jgi:hypothetical protein
MAFGFSFAKSSSKTYIDDITNIATNVIVDNASKCGNSAFQNQSITLKGVKGSVGNIDQNAQANINLNCLNSSQNDLDIQNQIIAQLKQYADSQANAQQPFFSANISISDTTAVSNVIRNIAANIRIDNIKNCLLASTQAQNVDLEDITGNIGNISQNVSISSILKCIQTDKNTIDNINNLKTAIDQTATSKASSGLSTTEFLGLMIISFIFLMFISSGVSLIGVLSSGEGGGGE